MNTTRIDSLHNILNDIIAYLCKIQIEYNCIGAENPGSLHHILNKISEYLCRIPLCQNCIIPDSEKDLHTILNEILKYLCDIHVGENCMDIDSPSDLHKILIKLTKYVCQIQISNSCIDNINFPDSLRNILTNIADYLCKIPIECNVSNVDSEKSLYETIGIIIDLYCNPRKVPLIHYCIDYNNINQYVEYSFSKENIKDLAEAVYGRQFTPLQRSTMNITVFCELKTFLVSSRGPSWQNSPTSRDFRLYITQYPQPDFWKFIDFEFRPDTSDCAFTRYTSNIKYQLNDIKVTIGPIGCATCDIWETQSASWKAQYPDPLAHFFAQRTRVSYRIHFLMGELTTMQSKNCEKVNINVYNPPPSVPVIANTGLTSTTAITSSTSSNNFIYNLVL